MSETLLFAEHGENILCTKIVLNVRNNFCTQHVLPRFKLWSFTYWTCNSMNNLSSYCGLVDAKTRASEKDLPVRMYVYSATTHRLFVTAKVNTDAMLPSRRCHGGRFCLIMCKNCEAFLPSKSANWHSAFYQTVQYILKLRIFWSLSCSFQWSCNILLN